ncbi:MAG: hypothetical protein N4A59_00280 [Marinifilum sp.]|jgi:hypothetical protein|nr:hypothetical protein [Marinifilum sp.]
MPHSLLSLFFPEGLLDYFDIIDFKEVSTGQDIYARGLTIYLEEKKIVPDEYQNHSIKSSGFMPAREIEDYPIRDMLVKLSIRRRRWDVVIDGKSKKVSRDWNLVITGTRMSAEYSAFLKEISRFQYDQH